MLSKIKFIFSLFILISLLLACSKSFSNNDFEIRVSNYGEYHGSILVTQTDGTSSSKSVSGSYSGSYNYTGYIISCSFQKS